MGQGGDGFGLALETGQGMGISIQMLGEDLDGHVALEPAIAGAIDFSHTSSAQGGDNLIPSEAGAGGEGHGGLRQVVYLTRLAGTKHPSAGRPRDRRI